MVGLIALLIFASVTFFILGVFYNIEYRQGRWKLIRRMKEQMGEEIRPEEKTKDFSVIKDHSLRIIGSLGERIMPKSEGELSNLRRTLLKAGFRRENATVIFFGIKASLTILLPVIFFFIKTSSIKIMTSLNFMLFPSCWP